jgi:RND superfamily putative drug exporter
MEIRVGGSCDAAPRGARCAGGVTGLSRSLPRALTSRRGAWISLITGVLLLIVALGVFGRAEMSAESAPAPLGSESARVAHLLATFPDADEKTLIVVAAATGGTALSANESAAVARVADDLASVDGAEVRGPFPSADGVAQVIQITAPVGDETGAERAFVDEVRAVVSAEGIDGVALHVTGGPAFGADIAAAFDGADLTLLLVTIGIVAALLIFTYRSPVLWLIPLVVVGLADQVASRSTAALGAAMGLQFDSGIVSVLVFGAGTNYALLMISRYREALWSDPDHRRALATAWRATTPAILASNVTVVLSLLTLVLAAVPGTRGLGIACAVGLVIALAAVLLVLPPALAVCGRGVFWPFVPRAGDPVARRGSVWRTVATRVVRRPWAPLAGGLVLLAVMSAGLVGASVGLSQAEKFRVPSESATGLEVLGDHFDAGEAQPFIVVADAAESDAVQDAAASVDGVVRVTETSTTADGGLVALSVVTEPAPGTPQSREILSDLRAAVHAVPGADAAVGGQGAVDADAREGNLQDFLLVAPLILLVTLLVLIVLLRALVAPLVLLAVNTLSAVAAIGAGAWLGRTLFGWDALDLQVPLLSFLFLVALGVDYTIFLVHRARSEARSSGTRAGMIEAVATTGGVITSAGLVLAGVFAALGLLPLVTLGQIGLIVGVGVLVDTLVVRTLIVPALFSVIGDRMWLPGRLEARPGGGGAEESKDAAEPALQPAR